ncbi:MAG: AtpZ/AtpI family protein [Deltaproteobacteria bacterium]|nr:AtpZ/AtpI family protein [Deltaproteobacteria bacterium]
MRRGSWRVLGSYGTIGLEIVLSVMVGYWAGHWLDGRLGTGPYLGVLGFLFGVAAAFKALWRTARQIQREAARDGFKQSDTDRPAKLSVEERLGVVPPPPGAVRWLEERYRARLERRRNEPDADRSRDDAEADGHDGPPRD